MNKYAVIYIENGLNADIPDLKDRGASVFPFWGNYKFIDFHSSQFHTGENTEKYLFLDKKYSAVYNELRSRIYNTDINLVNLQNSLEEFLEILGTIQAEKLVITSLSYIALFNEDEISNQINRPSRGITKISIDNTPVDMFIVSKKYFITLLLKNISQSLWKEEFSSYLFTEVLNTNFEAIKNISGKFIFSNNLMNLYLSNIQFIRNISENYVLNYLRKLTDTVPDNPGSVITRQGYAVNSLICSDVEISGYVENSIIFPGVIVKKNAGIINSVIMNNNRIGSKAVIKNSLVLPFYKEFMKNINSIDDRTEIGSENSYKIRNTKFPDQIYNGITVIGIDTVIGKDFKIEPGCYISGNINSKNMENNKSIPAGEYIINRISV